MLKNCVKIYDAKTYIPIHIYFFPRSFYIETVIEEIVQNVKDITICITDLVSFLHYISFFFFYGVIRSLAQLNFEICSFATHCFLRFDVTRGNHDSDLDEQINSCIDNFRIKYPNAYSGKSWKLIEKALKTQKI